VDSRVVAGFGDEHQRVDDAKQLFPFAKENLVCDAGPINEFHHGVEDQWNQLVGSKVGVNVGAQIVDDADELGYDLVDQVDRGDHSLLLVLEILAGVVHLFPQVELRLSEAALAQLVEEEQQHVDFVLLPIRLKLIVSGLEIKLLAHVDFLLFEFAPEGLQSLLDGLALHPRLDEFGFGSHLDFHEKVASGDAEALLDVIEHGEELVVFLEDIQDSLLLFLSCLEHDAVE
jgi:hypothetical protein